MRDPQSLGWPERGDRTEDFAEADRWKWDYLEWVKGERRRKRSGAPRERTLARAAEDFLTYRQSTTERATWGSDRTALNHLLDAVPGGTSLLAVTPEDVQELLLRMARQGYEASTLQTYLKSLGVFFRWTGHEATKGVTVANPGRGDVRTLEPEECDRVRAAAAKLDRMNPGDPSARLAIEIGLSMGLRQGEIFALRWDAIDAGDRSVRAQWQIPKDRREPKPLKGKRARTAGVLEEWWPLHRAGSGYVVARSDGGPLGTRPQRTMIIRVLDLAGISDVGLGWHLLRHTYARHFVERGGWIQELQRSLGHRSIRTTEERYGHFREDVAWKLAKGRIYGVS